MQGTGFQYACAGERKNFAHRILEYGRVCVVVVLKVSEVLHSKLCMWWKLISLEVTYGTTVDETDLT